MNCATASSRSRASTSITLCEFLPGRERWSIVLSRGTRTSVLRRTPLKVLSKSSGRQTSARILTSRRNTRLVHRRGAEISQGSQRRNYCLTLRASAELRASAVASVSVTTLAQGPRVVVPVACIRVSKCLYFSLSWTRGRVRLRSGGCSPTFLLSAVAEKGPGQAGRCKTGSSGKLKSE
jgi:hypothetical protein